MHATEFTQGQSEANPDFVAALVQASASLRHRGVARHCRRAWHQAVGQGLPVSGALQQRLLERKLRTPIESCLVAEDGVTPFYLHHALGKLLGAKHRAGTRTAATRPAAGKAAQANPPAPGGPTPAHHRVGNAPGRSGACRTSHGPGWCPRPGPSHPMDARLAMMGGLLHDIGEVYVQPAYRDGENPRDLVGHKHLMVHPRMGQLLLEGTTDYPAILCRAIGEHHERLNGSGYPARLAGDAISPLGMLLAVVETMLSHQHSSPAPLTSASFALRVVTDEYPEPLQQHCLQPGPQCRKKHFPPTSTSPRVRSSAYTAPCSVAQQTPPTWRAAPLRQRRPILRHWRCAEPPACAWPGTPWGCGTFAPSN